MLLQCIISTFSIWFRTSSAYRPFIRSNSVCVPISAIFPWWITAIVSAFRTVDSRWATIIVVRPFAALSSASCTTPSDTASSALVGSSRSRILGFLMMILAIATRCLSPPDSLIPRSPTRVSYPSGVAMIVS